MREPPELRELIGDEVEPGELARLEGVDSLLRRVPAPPHEVPQSLTQAVVQVPVASRLRPRRRRVALALAFAALLAALSFGAGRWSGGGDFETSWTVAMQPSASAGDASALIRVGERDEAGNFELLLDVSGLPQLEGDELYALWLSDDGEWAATCGYFAVGRGETTVRMTVSYEIREFDAWVISGGHRDTEHTPLLEAAIRAG